MRDGENEAPTAPEVTQSDSSQGDAAQGGYTSWEEPRLPLRERLHRHWRQMIVRVWGPAGSLVFHVVAIGVLLTCFQDKPLEEKFIIDIGPPTDNPVPPLDPPTQPPANNPGGDTSPTTVSSGHDVVSPQPPLPTDVAQNDPDIFPTPLENECISTPPVRTAVDVRRSMPTRTADAIRQRVSDYNPDAKNKLGDRRRTGHGDGDGDGDGTGIGSTTTTVPPTERAVLLSLRWLQHNQKSDGSWNGTATPAMTAMALLAFLGHGETPKSAEFGATVYKAIRWLIDNQDATGHFKGKDGNDYSQPIAAYALCEAYAMTQHPDLKEPASKAIAVVVNGQHASGGFNYGLEVSSARNDTSYSGWCIQALKAAKVAKLEAEVPGITAALKRGVAGLRLNADLSGGFGYTGPGQSGLSGVGVLGLQLLGASRSPEVASTMKFLEPCTFKFDAPEKQPYAGSSPLYYWYYITQAKFHHDRETFLAWNRQFSKELCQRQMVETVPGRDGAGGKAVEIGHWQSPSKGEHSGGVVQDTCLCTLMLEVYYRYLPSYQKPEALPAEMANGVAPDAVNVRIR